MTTQVDNGHLYLSQYCGPARDDGGSPLRVEIRGGGDAALLLDITWDQFQEIVRLGVVLVAKCSQKTGKATK